MDKKIKNAPLATLLEKLVKQSFHLYFTAFGGSTTYQPFQIGILMSQMDDNVKAIPEFPQAVQLMEKDSVISKLLGNLVGTVTNASSVESAETCILKFLNQLYLKNPVFIQTIFNEQYEAFEELFYSDNLRFVDTVRLYNFEASSEKIVLNNGLSIKRFPVVVDEQTKIQQIQFKPYIQFSKSDYIIEKFYTRTKRVGNAKTPFDVDLVSKEANESGDLFDQIIKALRIMKNSAVYRDHVISTEMLTFTPYAGIISRFPFLENTVIGNKLVISKDEDKELISIFENISKNENKSFQIASNRLGFGLERRFDEDRLIDYMIGLESIYLPDGQDELTFRLSLRIAFLMGKDVAERKDIFRFIKKMYHLRSKLVHGKKYDLTKDDVARIEEILRRSLKMFLSDPIQFSLDQFDKNGKLTKNGVLDNIFFNS